MKFIKILKAAYNENYDTIRFDYLTGEIDKKSAIIRLIEVGEAEDEEDAMCVISKWDWEGLTDEEDEYLRNI